MILAGGGVAEDGLCKECNQIAEIGRDPEVMKS